MTVNSSATVGQHRIWFVAYRGIQALDLVGPHEVFAAANQVADGLGIGRFRYHLRVVGAAIEREAEREAGGGALATESGLRLAVDPWPADPSTRDIAADTVLDAAPDTLLVPGGNGALELSATDPVVARVGQAAGAASRLACVCTGAFVAAKAGLLDNKQVTTHWARVKQLAAEHPEITVNSDAIYLVDGKVWTSAGVTAGIDLALAMVEADLGADVAQEVARWLVVFLRRAGGQSQFAPPVWSARSPDGPIRHAQDLIDRDPSAVASVADLAASVGLSPRHFTRRFTSEVGQSPARYLEQVRLAAARQQLELSDEGLSTVARRCGFGTTETLRRVFHRRLGVSPDAYRKHFSSLTLPNSVPAQTPEISQEI